MPSDTFTNQLLTDNDVLAIQGSTEDVLVLAQRFGLMPIEVKVIHDARPGAIGNPMTGDVRQPISLGSKASTIAPAAAGTVPPKIGSE